MRKAARLLAASVVCGFASAALLCPPLAAAASIQTGNGELVGTWRLISIVQEEFKSNEVTETIDANTKGEIIFRRDGRYSTTIVSYPDRDAGNITKTLTMSKSGQYFVLGDKLIQRIENSTGAYSQSESKKYYIGWSGEKLVLESTPIRSEPDGPAIVTTMTLERH